MGVRVFEMALGVGAFGLAIDLLSWTYFIQAAAQKKRVSGLWTVSTVCYGFALLPIMISAVLGHQRRARFGGAYLVLTLAVLLAANLVAAGLHWRLLARLEREARGKSVPG